MKSILFNAHSDEGHSRRLDLALDLARALDAHLTVLNAMPLEVGVSGDAYGAAMRRGRSTEPQQSRLLPPRNAMRPSSTCSTQGQPTRRTMSSPSLPRALMASCRLERQLPT